MEWLKDPKNQPVVAGILIGIILVVAVLMYFLYFKPPSTETAAEIPAATEPTATEPTAPAAPAPAPSAPVAPSQAPTGPQVQFASATPIEAWRPDPFLPMGYRPPDKNKPKPHPPITDLPVPGRLFDWTKSTDKGGAPELAQPARRMAGLLVNGVVLAVIESNGESEIVRPGDTLKDRLASVERIDRDKVVLKTKDVKPRYIVIRMASSPRGGVSSGSEPSSRPITGPGGVEPMGVRTRPGAPGGRVSPGPMDVD